LSKYGRALGRSAGKTASITSRASVEVFRDLASLEPVWCQIETHGHATVFQCWRVFQAWVRHIAEPQQIRWVVIGLMHPVSRAPLMLLPLAVRRDKGLYVIEFADLGVSDFNGPVFADGFRPDADEMQRHWNDIVDALPAGDLLHIAKIPHQVNGQKNPLLALAGVRRMNLSAFGTPIGDDWENLVRGSIEPALLKDIETRTRKLEKRGRVKFEVIADRAAAQPAFEAMCAQRAERHAVTQRPNILARPETRDFYNALFDESDRAGVAVIAILSIDGDIIATGYGLVRGKAFHMIFPTFKADRWRNYSPGLQIFLRTMRWASENGLTYFDFTIGAESFKLQFGASERPLYEKLVALSPRGLPAVMANRVKRVVRQSPAAANWALAALAAMKSADVRTAR
jgi:CelD/BcsL family acetyltransferase involved in cellulose biosynthesis